MISFVLALGCFVLGPVIAWRALVNANRMTRRTHHGIRALNWLLFIGGIAVALAPLATADLVIAALQGTLAVFVVCMFIGRRPNDRVLGG